MTLVSNRWSPISGDNVHESIALSGYSSRGDNRKDGYACRRHPSVWVSIETTCYPHATFVVDAARLVLCPIRLGFTAYAVRPCAAGLGGRILARGSQTLERQSHSVPLWAAGGVLLAVVRPTTAILLSGELGLFVPIERDGFRFEPDQEFDRVSSTLIHGGVGFGLEFP